MYRSLKKAEEAALNGEQGDEFDTQQCIELQEWVLSSPGGSPRIEAATNLENLEITNAANQEQTLVGELATHLTAELDTRQQQDDQVEGNDHDHIKNSLPRTASIETERADVGTLHSKEPLLYQRDSEGEGRLIDLEGQEVHRQVPSVERRHHAVSLKKHKNRQKMDDFQDTSSLTPTQANSDSLYAAYEIHNSIREKNPSNSQDVVSDDGGEEDRPTRIAADLGLSRQQHSTVTDSTAYTYAENDTGHVNFDFLQQSEHQNEDRNLEDRKHEMSEDLSQDASFRQPQLLHVSFEPQTPAAPVNPFSHKGSVLKGHEMFGATQPSSVGRHIASPTSSRPSPDVYRSSPQKQVATSPLVHHNDETPLQSSVRIMLRSKSAETPTRVEPLRILSRSFDRRREPRDTYVSSKESQERREKASSTLSSDSDTESDTELKTAIRRVRREERAKIEQQLAQVTSSRPGSGDSGQIEVPSTGRRRRSVQEEYLAQCDSLDARDTQQEDVIIDSQALQQEPEDMNLPDDVSNSAQFDSVAQPDKSGRFVNTSPKSSPKLPAHTSVETPRVPDLYANTTDEGSSQPKDPGSPLQQASLPLQEVSTNRNDLRTPVAKVQAMSDGADTTIPNTILETSPLAGDRIQPMGDISSLNFTDDPYDAMVDDVPGFTQDVEFENAIRPRLSPTPPKRLRVLDTFPSFERSTEVAKAPGLPSTSESPPTEPTNPNSAHSLLGVLAKGFELAELDATTAVKEIAPAEIPSAGPTDTKTETAQIEDVGQDAQKPPDKEALPPQDVRAEPVVGGPEPSNEDEVETEDEEADETRHAAGMVDEPQEQLTQPKQPINATIMPSEAPPPKRGGLRTKEELKGPSRALRRSDSLSLPTVPASQRKSFRPVKSSTIKATSTSSSKRASDLSSVLSTPLSSLRSTPSTMGKRSTRKIATATKMKETSPILLVTSTGRSATQARLANDETPVPAPSRGSRRSTLQVQEIDIPISGPVKRSLKHKSSALILNDEEPTATRSSKRQLTAQASRASSDDPLTVPTTTLKAISRPKKSTGVFQNMAFAVSYGNQDDEKAHVSKLIFEQGGRLLADGFENLFESKSSSKSRTQGNEEDHELTLSTAAKCVGFVAVIADEHSRRAKFMQGLALGLPCLSGRWITACVAKGGAVDWAPYLLCAGKSKFLGDAIRSRILAPYLATEAIFSETFSAREKHLEGKSILLVTGSGKAEENRRTFVFLTRLLGPARVGQVVDYQQARTKLLEDDTWDLLYSDKNTDHGISEAEALVFGAKRFTGGGSRKRKRGPSAPDAPPGPAPKKIRVINDEVILQSLILGQLLED